MAIRKAFIKNVETGEIVNQIVIDDEKPYFPDSGFVVELGKDITEEKTLEREYTLNSMV